ncbi:MAG TPA: hypothetical protein VMR14_24515 [Streptosporangiaceae bacterium]|nr:hypothetical protein [Streptosporangiaceae bacterium]
MSEFDPAAYNAFIGGLDLAAIELVKVSGERTVVGIATQSRFELTASYMQDDAVIYFRYEATAHFTDDHEVVLGIVSASIQLTARTAAAVSGAYLEQFGGTSGAFMAHPYLREVIASTAQRIGFPGVLLPMMKQQPAEGADD